MNNDLISRAAAIEIAMKYCPDDDGSCSKADIDIREMLDELENLLAADAEPVRHGRWIQSKTVPSYHSCSYCKRVHNMPKSCNVYVLPLYCPDCGAKMGLEVQG